MHCHRNSSRNKLGYRDYSEENLRHLRLVSAARACGFTLDECREMLATYQRVRGNENSSDELEPFLLRIGEKR